MKGQKLYKTQRELASDIAEEAITSWCLPGTIKSKLYKNKISDVYSLAACSKGELRAFGLSDFEVALIECKLKEQHLELKGGW